MANHWAAQSVREDGESSVVTRARRWLMVLYMPFYCFGLLVGFLAFQAFAPRSAVSIFIAVYHGFEPFSAAWPLVICGLVMAFTAPLLGQIGSLLWLVVSKNVLGLTAQNVRTVDPNMANDFLHRPLYRRLYEQREP
jgi:hypothetical protein